MQIIQCCCVHKIYLAIRVAEWFCRSLINVASVRGCFVSWVCYLPFFFYEKQRTEFKKKFQSVAK